MIDRMVAGEVPRKHHIASRDGAGRLRFEECFTRQGFDGPYSILYHQDRPHAQRPAEASRGWRLPLLASPGPLRKRHYRTQDLRPAGGPPLDSRVPLLFNDDVVLSLVTPSEPDAAYFQNGDGDDLYFVAEGGGLLRTTMGDVPFAKEEYVFVPKGLLHRFAPDPGPQRWLAIECLGGLCLPRQFVGDAEFRHPLRWINRNRVQEIRVCLQ